MPRFLEGREGLLFVGRLFFAFLLLLSPGYMFPLLVIIRTFCHVQRHCDTFDEEETFLIPPRRYFNINFSLFVWDECHFKFHYRFIALHLDTLDRDVSLRWTAASAARILKVKRCTVFTWRTGQFSHSANIFPTLVRRTLAVVIINTELSRLYFCVHTLNVILYINSCSSCPNLAAADYSNKNGWWIFL